MSHTRGPWLYRGKSDTVHMPCETHPYGDLIFQFHGEFGPKDGDLDLILSAPDLLEALINLKREVVLSDIPEEHIKKLYPFFQAANEAITKATGK